MEVAIGARALDYRAEGPEPAVVVVASESGETAELASSFAAFLAALVPCEHVYHEDGERRAPAETSA